MATLLESALYLIAINQTTALVTIIAKARDASTFQLIYLAQKED